MAIESTLQPSMEDIQRYAVRVAEAFNPDKIILFGSRANGTFHEESDVDLLVIMPFQGRNFEQSVKILTTIHPNFPLDLLARTPSDTEARYLSGDPLIGDAIDNGKVLYARTG